MLLFRYVSVTILFLQSSFTKLGPGCSCKTSRSSSLPKSLGNAATCNVGLMVVGPERGHRWARQTLFWLRCLYRVWQILTNKYDETWKLNERNLSQKMGVEVTQLWRLHELWVLLQGYHTVEWDGETYHIPSGPITRYDHRIILDLFGLYVVLPGVSKLIG
jgi:hypothetical protein